MPVTRGENTSLESLIKAEALRLGFSLCGITTTDPPEHGSRFDAWIEQGFHADMAYLESGRHRTNRRQPTLLMHNARTIIVCAWQYPLRKFELDSQRKNGWQAAYSAGMDYHHILPEKMLVLKTFIASQMGLEIEGLAMTDSMPLLEREIAVRAGLGWIGKNSCLISPKFGSAFLLAELMVDVHLTPDVPFEKEYCGTCHRCLDICPTQCITPQRMLDAKGCISYLTVENKGEIPMALRGAIGGWLFGCDLCQMVCPWNRKASEDAFFLTSIDWTQERIVELLHLSTEEIKRQYGGSGLERCKPKGLRRNALNWLGNCGEISVIPVIQRFLEKETDPILLAAGQWAIQQLDQQ